MEGLILTTPEQLQNYISVAIRNEITKLIPIPANQPTPTPTDQLRTRIETAKILRVTLATLNDYTKSGKIVANRIGNRVLYKDSDIQSALSKVKTSKIAA